MRSPADAKASTTIPSLDGLRAIAVGLVFFSHGGAGSWVPGGLGVTVFFVLSGFLITVLLRREHTAHGQIALRAFYLRRLLRLMPPLLAIVALSGVLSSLDLIDGDFSLRGLFSVLFYLGNYHVIATDFGGLPAGLGVVWSLAVEEHYYLLYPPLAVLLLRSASPGQAALVLGGLCVLMLGWRTVLFLGGASPAYLGMATDTRADAILIGCACGFLCDPALRPSADRLRDAAIALACLAVLLLTLVYREPVFRHTLRYSLQGLVLAPLILIAVRHAAHPGLRWLQFRPLVYVGTVSYSVYLVHQVMLYGVMRHAPALGAVGTLVLTAALALSIAELIRRWVEAPLQQWRRRLRTPSPGPAPHVSQSVGMP
jgi:peptidoglycan/LPS O-acetylase OafA/YrhL